MRIQYEDHFDYFANDDKSRVFQLFPDSYKDNRGYFMEVLKDYGQWPYKDIPMWLSNPLWVRQINRSASKQGVVRGCHAQKGLFCQGKLVEAVTDVIFDIITDVRPTSNTFGVSCVFKLDPKIHNMLWVPRGFLHCVVFPRVEKEAILQYYCDQVYDKPSEFCVNPVSIIPTVIEDLKKLHDRYDISDTDYADLFNMFDNQDSIIYSEKDLNNISYSDFVTNLLDDYKNTGKLWYR